VTEYTLDSVGPSLGLTPEDIAEVKAAPGMPSRYDSRSDVYLAVKEYFKKKGRVLNGDPNSRVKANANGSLYTGATSFAGGVGTGAWQGVKSLWNGIKHPLATANEATNPWVGSPLYGTPGFNGTPNKAPVADNTVVINEDQGLVGAVGNEMGQQVGKVGVDVAAAAATARAIHATGRGIYYVRGRIARAKPAPTSEPPPNPPPPDPPRRRRASALWLPP